MTRTLQKEKAITNVVEKEAWGGLSGTICICVCVCVCVCKHV